MNELIALYTAHYFSKSIRMWIFYVIYLDLKALFPLVYLVVPNRIRPNLLQRTKSMENGEK